MRQQEKFEGGCIDGPWIGRNVSSPQPRFNLAMKPRVQLALSPKEPATYTPIRFGTYEWDFNLQAWRWKIEK